MPLNVRRFCTSFLLVLFGFILVSSAQTISPVLPPVQQPAAAAAPTSGEIMRERISKAKAFIAVKNFNAAIYELENIRKETSDPTVRGVTNVLLMNSYLEQGDYKRAQDFLTEFFNDQKPSKPDTSAFYFSIAGQVVKGAKNQVERYRGLGLSVSDRNLPLEAITDIEKMRETLELVITQSKALSKEKARTPTAMALLEEAANSRSSLARDDYDARRWKDETADAREELANSRSVILSAVNDTPVNTAGVANAASTTPVSIPETAVAKVPENTPVFKPVSDPSPAPTVPVTAKEEPKVSATETAGNDSRRIRVVGGSPGSENTPNQATTSIPQGDGTKDVLPLEIGSLIAYATKQQQPVYPPAAKNMRMTGLVKVEVVINESGEVAEVQKTSGPTMLQGAAKDAARRWKFKPFMRDGQPVKATGFINFNFAL
jgi:TonB family protein